MIIAVFLASYLSNVGLLMAEGMITAFRPNGFIVVVPRYHVKGAVRLVAGQGVNAPILTTEAITALIKHQQQRTRGQNAAMDEDDAAISSMCLTCELQQYQTDFLTVSVSGSALVNSKGSILRTYRLFDSVSVVMTLDKRAQRYRTPQPSFRLLWTTAAKVLSNSASQTSSMTLKSQKNAGLMPAKPRTTAVGHKMELHAHEAGAPFVTSSTSIGLDILASVSAEANQPRRAQNNNLGADGLSHNNHMMSINQLLNTFKTLSVQQQQHTAIMSPKDEDDEDKLNTRHLPRGNDDTNGIENASHVNDTVLIGSSCIRYPHGTRLLVRPVK